LKSGFETTTPRSNIASHKARKGQKESLKPSFVDSVSFVGSILVGLVGYPEPSETKKWSPQNTTRFTFIQLLRENNETTDKGLLHGIGSRS
jgi:hypothetical protein